MAAQPPDSGWYYQAFGKTFGPTSADELVEMATKGDLTPESLVRHETASDWIPARQAFPKLAKRGIKEIITQPVITRKEKRFPCPHCSQKALTRELFWARGPMKCPKCGGGVGFSPASKLIFFVAFVAPTALLLLAYYTTGFSGFLDDLGVRGGGAKALMFGSMAVGFLFAHAVSGVWIGLVKR